MNREMILNYVAQHSLGLPRSYYGESDRMLAGISSGRIDVGDSLTRSAAARPGRPALVDLDADVVVPRN